jgi:hypothetical protein
MGKEWRAECVSSLTLGLERLSMEVDMTLVVWGIVTMERVDCPSPN